MFGSIPNLLAAALGATMVTKVVADELQIGKYKNTALE